MSRTLPVHRSGLLFGALFAASHAAWIGFVLAGVSESTVATVARANYVEYEDTVDFDPSLTGLGLAIAFAAGYAMGGLFALLWNATERSTSSLWTRRPVVRR
ncbi:hypothetical protein [Halomicrobium salinisoli]|uniref:hypothetical protein n=1 Tax=Halomicrobium salinisoli TaxID=2878391 RepID=UPI001CF07B73|nr:hypothetical protein [Halomicrobium salinisoli]